jgi:hypothetical protein
MERSKLSMDYIYTTLVIPFDSKPHFFEMVPSLVGLLGQMGQVNNK